MKKNTTLNFLVAIALLFMLSGCGSSLMTGVSTIEQPDNGMALVTVLRPSVFGGAIKFSLWDGDQFKGILTAKSYIQFQAPPGHHLIMARAENWSGVDAELQAGRHYYIIARVMPGAWKARVALDPVSRDQYDEGKIDKWLKGLNPIAIIPGKAEVYATPRLEQVRTAIDNFENGRGTTMILKVDDGV
jgi:hypothetical protein